MTNKQLLVKLQEDMEMRSFSHFLITFYKIIYNNF